MLLLKKKRYQEQLLDKTENQISNLERMVSENQLLWAASGLLCALGISLFPGVDVPFDCVELHFNCQALTRV